MVRPSDGVDGVELEAGEPSEHSQTVEPSGPDSLLSALLRTEGGADLPRIQQEYAVDRPTALCIRGVQKLAGSSGFPAIADLLAGIVLLTLASGFPAGQESEESPEPSLPDL